MDAQDLRAGAEQCVKCGLCLPRCPTWRLRREEGDSPRGRLALIAAAAGGLLDADAALRGHLEGCLLCRACEAACPARVPFGRLMDQALRRWPARPVFWTRLFRHAALRGLARFGLWLLTASGAARAGAARGPAWLRDRLAMLPAATALRRRRTRRRDGPRVGLFPGCVTDVLDRRTLNDAAALLERAGVAAEWLPGAGCCGALDRHQGAPAAADRQLRRNLDRADPARYAALLSVATGCGAELSDYAALSAHPRARAWSGRHRDAADYLAAGAADRLRFRPLSGTALVHQPCSARQLPGDPAAPAALLRRIPGLAVRACAQRDCCGAGGTAMFRRPEQAAALADGIVRELAGGGARWLVTANIGCALHLRRAAARAGLAAEVLHPLNLLRRQLEEGAGAQA